MCAYVHVHMCAHVCRGQKSTSVVFHHHWAFPPPPPSFLRKTFSVGEPIAHWLARLAVRQTPGILPSPSLHLWGWRHLLPHLAITQALGAQTQVLMLGHQALCPLSHLLSPCFILFVILLGVSQPSLAPMSSLVTFLFHYMPAHSLETCFPRTVASESLTLLHI